MPCADLSSSAARRLPRAGDGSAGRHLQAQRLGALHRRRRGYARRELPSCCTKTAKIVMLNRKLDELAPQGPPHHARDGIDKLAEQRMPRYRAWATTSSTHATAPPTPPMPSSTPSHPLSNQNQPQRGQAPFVVVFQTAKEATMKALVIKRPQPQHARHSRARHLRQRQLRSLSADLPGSGCRTGLRRGRVFQSNHEGSIVDKIQEAYGKVTASSSTRPPTRTQAWPSWTRSKPSPSRLWRSTLAQSRPAKTSAR